MRDFDAVGTVAFFRERQRAESSTTAKVLRAMTPQMMSYQPNLASSSLGVTAWTIVRCLRACLHLTQNPVAELSQQAPPRYEELIATFEALAQDLNAALLPLTQKDWEELRIIQANARTLLEQPLGQILWLFHVDAIHHRGQISAFLRSFGASVPSIYGPSGDCQS